MNLSLQWLVDKVFNSALLFNPNHKRLHSIFSTLKALIHAQLLLLVKNRIVLFYSENFGELLISREDVESSKQCNFLINIKLKLKRCVVSNSFRSLLFSYNKMSSIHNCLKEMHRQFREKKIKFFFLFWIDIFHLKIFSLNRLRCAQVNKTKWRAFVSAQFSTFKKKCSTLWKLLLN